MACEEDSQVAEGRWVIAQALNVYRLSPKDFYKRFIAVSLRFATIRTIETEYLSVIVKSVDSTDRSMRVGATSPTKMKRRGRPTISGGLVTVGGVPPVSPSTAGRAGMRL